MERLPTLVLLANIDAQHLASSTQSLPISLQSNAGDSLLRQFQNSLSCNLPLRLIAPSCLIPIGENLLPGNCIINIESDSNLARSDEFARFISAGVSSSADSMGWLILPVTTNAKPDTIKNIALKLQTQSTVYPLYRQARGFPIGFSSEFFSELTQLKTNRDFNRLLMRYPAFGVSVDDPGVIPAGMNSHSYINRDPPGESKH